MPIVPQQNELVAQKSVFAGEAGIDPSLYNPDGSLLQSPSSFPNLDEEPQLAPPVVERTIGPLRAAAPLEYTEATPLSTAPYQPSGMEQIRKITDPVNAARRAEVINLQTMAAEGAAAAAKERPTTWALPDIDASLASFGNNADAIRESLKRQAAARPTENQPNPSESPISALRNPDTVIDLPGVLVWMPLVAIVFFGLWFIKRLNRSS